MTHQPRRSVSIFRRALFTTLTLTTSLCLSLPVCLFAAPPQANKQAATGKAAKPKAVKQKVMMILMPQFALDVDNTKLVYAITINGFPVDASPGNTNGHFSSTRVGEYIADGQNTITIHLSAPEPKFLSSFGVTLRATGNPKLFDYGWDASVPHPRPPLPVQKEGHFTAHLPTGPWAWQTAPKITLDAPTKAAINAHLKRLFDALDTKNMADSIALFAPRNHEIKRSQGWTAAEADKDSREGWEEKFAKPGWQMYPIDYPHLRYKLVANGRVVHMMWSDGGMALFNATPNPDGLLTGYNIYMCQVHGQWTLIR